MNGTVCAAKKIHEIFQDHSQISQGEMSGPLNNSCLVAYLSGILTPITLMLTVTFSYMSTVANALRLMLLVVLSSVNADMLSFLGRFCNYCSTREHNLVPLALAWHEGLTSQLINCTGVFCCW